MTSLAEFAVLAVLGGIGAVARFLLMSVFPERLQPVALLVVNASGSAIAGAALGLVNTAAINSSTALAFVAFAAGFTTLSTLAVSAAQWIARGQLWRGINVAALHIIAGAVCAGAGYIFAGALFVA